MIREVRRQYLDATIVASFFGLMLSVALFASNTAIAQSTSSATWIYDNGVMNWPGDWSWDATINYADTAGEPRSGLHDIAVTVTSGTGGWQPYAPNASFDTSPYAYLVFSLKPTVVNQTWAVGVHAANNAPDGNTLENIAQYGPPGGPVVGRWGTYRIPLSAFSLSNKTIFNLFIQDQRGTGVFYIDNVGFTTNSTLWVYDNGVMNWPGDWSWNAGINYKDTAGQPLSGADDIAVTVTSGTGGWQPFAPQGGFETAPYNSFVVSLKPTVANQTWAVGLRAANNTADGDTVENIAQYGPPGGPVVGQWGTYTIPLSAFALNNTNIFDFFVQDQRGTGVFYVDNVGFSMSKATAVTTPPVTTPPVTTPPVTTPPVTTPPVTTPPATTTSWVYYNGAFDWAGQWDSNATPDYQDTAGAPLSGAYDIAVTVVPGTTGLWQPYINGNCQTDTSLCFVTTPYKHLIFSLKPTVANSQFGVAFMSSGDKPDGNNLGNIAAYCSGGSNPPIGQWESCSIPLTAFAFIDPAIVKFFIQAQSKEPLFYVDNVGFTVD